MKVDQKALVSPQLKQHLGGFGQLLRKARMDAKLTQEAAAQLSNVSRQTISRIESGDPSVSFGQVSRYAEALDVLELIGGVKPASPDVTGRRVRNARTTNAK